MPTRRHRVLHISFILTHVYDTDIYEDIILLSFIFHYHVILDAVSNVDNLAVMNYECYGNSECGRISVFGEADYKFTTKYYFLYPNQT